MTFCLFSPDDGECNRSMVSFGPSLDSGPTSELDFDSETDEEVGNTGEYDDYDVEYEVSICHGGCRYFDSNVAVYISIRMVGLYKTKQKYK